MAFRLSALAGAALLYTGLVTGCGGDSGTTELKCGVGTSGTLSASSGVVVAKGDAEDLAGAAIEAAAGTTIPSGEVSIDCADADIVPDGFIALGPAVTFGPEGTWSDRPFQFTLPYKRARLPEGGVDRHVRIVARRHIGDRTPFFPPVSNKRLDEEDEYASTASFLGGELATYQMVAPADAGTMIDRRYEYRAIVGVSMGGDASLSIGLRNHDKFDLIGDLGGEPGPSKHYSMSMISNLRFGGFCTVEDQMAGNGNVGEMCPGSQRAPKSDQFELVADYEHLLYQAGEGVGLTLNRDFYMKGFRDFTRAYGNPSLYNVDDPYLPPGVDWTYADQDASARCGNPVVLNDFFDEEFNPDGALPVITFCDGGDSPELGLGVFDPTQPQDNPAEMLLAVDVNNNGVRDSGEPLINNMFEPWEDIGADGTASVDEAGYDAVTNPDPAGDDFHYLRNPLGTEGNWQLDDGEPWDDFGLDGVEGTCQQGDDPGLLSDCFDYGEGDGMYTINPNLERWYDSGLDYLWAAMTDDERQRVNIWFDAGIRDFLNCHLSANIGMSKLMAQMQYEGGVYDGFNVLTNSSNGVFDFSNIDWTQLPRNGYVRYGNPDATDAQINNGDGRHVGTALQLINRITTSFAWLDKQYPNGDRTTIQSGGQIIDDLSFTAPTTGRETPFSLFLPPGYEEAENADVRYPVIYFLHGYGMSPEDLVLASAIFENYMINPDWEEERRFQKFIIVYVDGLCRPKRDGVPVDPTGDKCERGTFYMDHPAGGPAQMETNMLELIEHIDSSYRTKQPETVSILK
jgi:hypothetical protein